MKPRERIKKTLEHIEPDRVPIDLGGISGGIHESAYRKLLDHLNMEDDIIIYDPIQRLSHISEEVCDYLGADTRYVFPTLPFPYLSPFSEFKDEYLKYEEEEFTDGWGTINRRVGNYSDVVKPVLRGSVLKKLRNINFRIPRIPRDLLG